MEVTAHDDLLHLGNLHLRSRLLLGTGRFPSRQVLLDAMEASGTELVTVALRRIDPKNPEQNLFSALKDAGLHLLPNTAGCFTAKDAVLTAELAREALQTPLIKLEVIADEETLLPEPVELLRAAETLVKLGFHVLPYTNDDPITAQRLEQLGCKAVMPLAAPIGSGKGIRNRHNLELIRQYVQVPVIVDAGIGTASDVVIALEIGCDAVLLDSAVSRARHPVRMATAMRHAAIAGREAHLAGRIPVKHLAEASTPLGGRLKTHG